MGYLHEGHLSLVRVATTKCDDTIVSIFVNPTQFSPDEDLDNYPRDLNHDIELCKAENVSCIFYPTSQEIYSSQHKTYVITEHLSTLLCGRTRPIHFKGVTTVVLKLFNITETDVAVFGQKDAQQSIIIQRMVDDLNLDIEILIAPTVREYDGLAKSSRNKYLNDEQRLQAPILYKSLQWAKSEIAKNKSDFRTIRKKMYEMIEKNSSGNIDYIEIVNSKDLTPQIYDDSHILIAVAVYFGNARLIDNILIQR
jgi:pantoate--beta-alanine ligase